MHFISPSPEQVWEGWLSEGLPHCESDVLSSCPMIGHSVILSFKHNEYSVKFMVRKYTVRILASVS